jgi:hypothetical protein
MNKAGQSVVTGDIVIDCTGDADVAAGAGSEFRIGRDGDALMQPFTLMSKYLNMDWPRAFAYVREHQDRLRALAEEEVGNDGGSPRGWALLVGDP